MSYLRLDLIFLAILFVADAWLFRTKVWRRKSTWVIFFWLALLTFVFDTLLTALPVVTYNAAMLTGIYLGSIPIEDFAYTLALVVIIPMLWEIYRRADRS